MIWGTLEAGGLLWGWDVDGDDDWEGTVLALLALAVVATTALALQWFGFRQDQEEAVTLSTAPGVQFTQTGGVSSTLRPKSNVSGTSERQSLPQGKSDAPGHNQRRPVTAGAKDREPSRDRGMASTDGLSLNTPSEVAGRGVTSGTHQDKGKETVRPNTDLLGQSKARGMPAPVLIHFTARSPGNEAEMQMEVASALAKGPAPQAPVHTEQQDTSPCHLGVGSPGLLGRGLGSRPRRPGDGSGDRRHPPKPDPLRLGTVVSVWDAVDGNSAAAQIILARSPCTGSPLPGSDRGPGTQEPGGALAAPTQADCSKDEDALRRSTSQLAPADTAGSGETESPVLRKTQGVLALEEAWPWVRGAAVVTNFNCDQGTSPEELPPEACEADQVSDKSGTEKLGGHCIREGRGSLHGQGSQQEASSPAADQRPARSLGTAKSTVCRSRSPSCSHLSSPVTGVAEVLQSVPPAAPISIHSGLLPAPSNSLHLGISHCSNGENLRAALASFSVPILASTEISTSVPATTSPTSPQNPASDSVAAAAPSLAPAPAIVIGSSPVSEKPSEGLSRSSKEGRISTSWGNLITMVLRSHPFPKQDRLQESALGAILCSPAGPITSIQSEDTQPGFQSEGAISRLQNRHRPLSGLVPSPGLGGVIVAECQPQPMSIETNGDLTFDSPPDPRRDGAKEESLDLQSLVEMPTAPSQPPVYIQPGPLPSTVERQNSQPIPQPQIPSLCEIAQNPEQVATQATPRQSQGQVPEEGASPAFSRRILTEKQKEAQKLLVFLQRPSSWGVVERPGKSHSRALQPATEVALCSQRLDLSSCLEVLAFAQQHGELSLAQETYTLMSNNLLHVLGDPHLYRQLSGADRERILSLRTCQGQVVLGVLVLPSLYQVSRSDLTKDPLGEEDPTAEPEPLPRHLHMFSPQENVWKPLTQLPQEVPLRGCGLCTMHNYLFLAGGIRGHGAKAVCSNEVFCYNPLTNIWSQIRPMQQARAQLKLVALDGLLYAIGGECLYSMERYDPRTDNWTSRASLPEGTFPVAHEAVACRGDIYVTGGHLFYRLLRYSPVKDSWDECPYSASHRRSSDMVALGGFLYRFDLLRGVGASVMRYNTVTGSWSRPASLPLPNPAPIRCTVLGNTIYCLNHQVTATFTVSEGTAQFQAKELQPFPLASKGVLCPFILTLPPKARLQTTL
uniref:kelch domain-containing protein 7B n=1 Tax=Jaculus jaculus TaxID=51337 RepID=UPI001E1B4DE6|nr:kelch domain-containing protein 7B [Jaculus jaculus]